MDIPGTLPKTKKGNQYVVVVTERFYKMTREVPGSTKTAPHMAVIFLDCSKISYGIPCYILTDRGPQFVSRFVASVCSFLGVKSLTTMAYHHQTNGESERYNETFVTRLHHYVAEQ